MSYARRAVPSVRHAERPAAFTQLAAQQALVDPYADSYRLSFMRFRAGVDSYLPTRDSQRELYGGQQALITLKQAELADLITLYKAVGGGWNEQTVSIGVQFQTFAGVQNAKLTPRVAACTVSACALDSDGST
jgi:hypothetical protein